MVAALALMARETTAPMLVTEGIAIQVELPVWDAECTPDRHLKCVASLPLVLENHAKHAVVLERFDIRVCRSIESNWCGRIPFELPPRTLSPGSRLGHTLTGVPEKENVLFVVAVVRAPQGRQLQIPSRAFVLPNQARRAAEKACRQARGDWRVTYSGRHFCAARAPDGGKICRDGLDCRGSCLFERYELVGPPEGRVQKGRPVGRCSEFLSAPSCFDPIGKGESQSPPVDVHTPRALICSD